MNFISEPCPGVKASVAGVSSAIIKFCIRNLGNLAAIDFLLCTVPAQIDPESGIGGRN